MFSSAAPANPPSLMAISGEANRHPSATFSAPRARSVSIAIAMAPSQNQKDERLREKGSTMRVTESSDTTKNNEGAHNPETTRPAESYVTRSGLP